MCNASAQKNLRRDSIPIGRRFPSPFPPFSIFLQVFFLQKKLWIAWSKFRFLRLPPERRVRLKVTTDGRHLTFLLVSLYEAGYGVQVYGGDWFFRELMLLRKTAPIPFLYGGKERECGILISDKSGFNHGGHGGHRDEKRILLDYDFFSGVTTKMHESEVEELTTIERQGGLEKEQPQVGPKGEGVGTTESKSSEVSQGNAQENSAGATFSHLTTSELARVSANASLPRFASCHASSIAISHSLLATESEVSSLATSYSPHATTASPEVVFLAFGFIRNNKNLDLVIRALTEFPRAHLIVMGKAQSQKDKPVEFYRKLAEELALSERVKFFDTFVPDEKLASYFAAADVVVLTYDKSFHSQSGVLNVAARARRPVLASAGESPLKDCVEKFRLGVFVEPDDMRALKEGIKKISSGEWRASSGEPDWQGYEAFASWDVNVAKILDAVEDVRQKKLKW